MSGRFAGSRSLDERRRRRLAVDEGVSEQKSLPPDGDPVRSLPVRRPTARFPLGRIVSRSYWKLVTASLLVALLCGGVVAAGQASSARAGHFGPGVSNLLSEEGRLAPTCGGLLLLLVSQFALLIRWARARSFRDFHGRYRIWRWTAVAAGAAGLSVLTDAHIALAATLTWAMPHLPTGLGTYFQIAPAIVAILFLTPSLQKEARGCRISRSLIFTSASLYLCGLLSIAAESALAEMLARASLTVSAACVQQALLLLGTATAFSGMLFHTRHVIYESAEPPEPSLRIKKVGKKSKDAREEASPDSELAAQAKTKRASSRRTKRSAPEADSEKAAAKTLKDEQSSPIRKPHFALAADANSKSEKNQSSGGGRDAEIPAAQLDTPKTTAKVAEPPIKQANLEPQHDMEDDGDEEGMVEINGRLVRLDGPEEGLKGLSKRDRRKLRKAAKDRDRAGV